MLRSLERSQACCTGRDRGRRPCRHVLKSPLTAVPLQQRAEHARDRLLEDIPTRDGYDRDEYPPAVGRGKGKDLERGSNPHGWMAHVRYVPSSENRSHGSSMGAQLRRFCNGVQFRYAFSTN